jgi:hypothetical protein
MKSLPFLFSVLALAACGKESGPVASRDAAQAMAPSVTADHLPAAPRNTNANILSGFVSLWSKDASTDITAEPMPTPDVRPVPTPEDRMADEIRRFKEGQRLRQMRSDLGYSDTKPSDRLGDKVALRQGDLAGQTSHPASTLQHSDPEAFTRSPVINPEKRLATKQRMAEEIRRFKEGQALRLAQSNSMELSAASTAPMVNNADGRTGSNAGLRPGDSVGARPGDANASY